MAIGTWLRKLAGRDALFPRARLEVVIVAHRVGQLGLEVLELLLAIVLKQPVESLLIVWSTDVSVTLGSEQCQILTHR